MNEESNLTMFQGEKYRITVYSEILIRFEYSPDGKFYDGKTHFAQNRNFDKINLQISDESKTLVVASPYFTFQYAKEKSYFTSKLYPDGNLRVKVNGTDRLWYPTHAEARNFKANSHSIENMKDMVNIRGLFSTDGFASYDDSLGLIVDDDGNLKKRVDGNVDIYLFVYKRDYALCLRDYFKLTGSAPMIPKYALGIWWNRDRIYNTNDAQMLINLFRKYDIGISVFLLSEFWHIKDSNNYNAHKSGYTYNKELIPSVDNFLNWMHNSGVMVGLNFDPSEGIRKEEDSYSAFADIIKVENFGNIPFNVFDIDFMNMFIDKVLKKIECDFLWIDYNKDNKVLEALNYHVKNVNNDEKRYFTLSRNYGLGSHRYPVLYSGETTVSWKSLDYLPRFNAGAANYGVSYWSHDVGGFKDGTESDELYIRYVQFSCFSPIFRFSAKRGVYYKREPWLWDIKTMTIVRNYCDLRYKLIPYLYSEGYKYHKNGIPIFQPLYYRTPFIIDEPVYKNEYYFGKEILVAPITKKMNSVINRSIEKVYMPEGTWYDFRTGKKFLGDKRYVTFYKSDEYPIFVRAGAIVPLNVLSDKKNSMDHPSTLEVNVFPGDSNSYKLFEDDGESLNYKNGDYLITEFKLEYKGNSLSFVVKPVEGKSDVIPDERNYVFKFHNLNAPSDIKVVVNGNSYDKYDVIPDAGAFILRVYDVDTTRQLTIHASGESFEQNAERVYYEDINSILFDLEIETNLKEKLADILFSDRDLKRKRILVNKLKKEGLNAKFANVFLKLLEYNSEL